MSAKLEVTGMVELQSDLQAMAMKLAGDKEGRTIRYILQDSCQPILSAMLRMCPTGATKKLRDSIKIGRVVSKRRKRGFSVSVGVHKENGVMYANPVENGHGGPHPAPPHPFVRPAFDATKEQAYSALRDRLRTALDARGIE